MNSYYHFVYVDQFDQTQESDVQAQQGTVVGSLQAMPSLQTLAAAIFRTDPDVSAFVARVSDWSADAECCAPDYTGPCARCDAQEERFGRAMLIAWDRDENGWRTAAMARAELVLQALATDNERTP